MGQDKKRLETDDWKFWVNCEGTLKAILMTKLVNGCPPIEGYVDIRVNRQQLTWKGPVTRAETIEIQETVRRHQLGHAEEVDWESQRLVHRVNFSSNTVNKPV